MLFYNIYNIQNAAIAPFFTLKLLPGELTSWKLHKAVSAPLVYQKIYILSYMWKNDKAQSTWKNKKAKCCCLPKNILVSKEGSLLSGTEVVSNLSRGPRVKWWRSQMQQILQDCFIFLPP